MPDPLQPRRVLPEQLHFAFHSNRLTPIQALRELIQIAQISARQHGRPFTSIMDYLADDTEDEESATEDVRLTPEEQLVRELVNLALTIRDDGQVNPLTVVDVTRSVTQLYRIETGERRFWATWLVRDFLPNYEGDGTIPCIIVPSNKASAFRQAKENTARSGLSAIALARQAALLLLTVHGVERPEGVVGNDFYRQALMLDLRDKREFTVAMLGAMGGITKSRFAQLKALLQLSDDALELADRHNLDEFRLRYVLGLDEVDQAEMVRQIISLNLTGRQVKELCQPPDHGDDKHAQGKEARQFSRLMRAPFTSSAQSVAKMLLEQDKDTQIVYARLQALKKFIAEIEQHLG